MAKVIYSMNVSLDGYIEDSNGSFGFSVPDEDVHRQANEQAISTACRWWAIMSRANPAAAESPPSGLLKPTRTRVAHTTTCRDARRRRRQRPASA